MVSRTGPWANVFPSLAQSPTGNDTPVCRLAQVIPALDAPNALDLIDSIRFFSARDDTASSGFPVLIHRDHPHHVQSPPNSRSPSPVATADPTHVSLTLLVLPHIAGMITVDDRATICAIHPGLAKQLVGKAAKYLVGEPLGDVFPLLPNVIRRLAARSTAVAPTDGDSASGGGAGGAGGEGSSTSLASSGAASSIPNVHAGSGTVVDEAPATSAALARMGAVSDGPVVSAATIRRLATSMAAAAAAEADGKISTEHKHHHHHHYHAPTPTTSSSPGGASAGIKPGVYCVHRDGGRITCDVQVRPLATLAGRIVFSLWVTFDHAVHRWALPAAAPAPADTPGSPVAASAVAPAPHPPPLGQKLVGKSAADYDLIHRMGEGAYGQVQLVRDRASGSMLALKLIDKDKIVPDAWTKRKPYGVIPREIAILADLYDDAGPGSGYPGAIVKMVGFWEGPREFGLEMQVHGEGVDLFEYIERMKGMSEEVARRIFFQVCTAVAYLHERKICHRDIKDENVILDHELNAQLIDFGSAAYVRSEKATFDTFAGTLEYCSPEVILGKRYQGKPQDIWALGILMYVMLFRECPFFTDDEVLLRSVQVPKGVVVSAEAVSLLKALLNKDLVKRPTIEQVVAHAWFDVVRVEGRVAESSNQV
ncbi:kinase-like domain-containing protein [Catenaria anguillulae PL171]|uniref:Kinase-like domain-containing protein n=1 Tax=Catenaria anguillulae PL171 TaxID=765915 RepID=A0A1Y2HUM6_9FUNG|nr:kinase-like domain-containing protein [Catenaria anguillulae PL171]